MSKYLSIFLISFVLFGCDHQSNQSNQSNQAITSDASKTAVGSELSNSDHSAQIALDYMGTYVGTLPVDGQQLTLKLTLDEETYTLQIGDAERSGHYSWHDQGNVIYLQDKDGHVWLPLFVAENRLLAVDENNQWILDENKQPYALIKQ
ncbi:hypothetical protein RHO15_10145 [Utexia brackfieldae]|uniref:hypothetical protein n=1 Tax=Utexia brackfieldae TaxID=3074108 RepID=UPI00370D456E